MESLRNRLPLLLVLVALAVCSCVMADSTSVARDDLQKPQVLFAAELDDDTDVIETVDPCLAHGVTPQYGVSAVTATLFSSPVAARFLRGECSHSRGPPLMQS